MKSDGSNGELQFFEINFESGLSYFLIKSLNRLFRPLNLSIISENINNSSMSSSHDRLST